MGAFGSAGSRNSTHHMGGAGGWAGGPVGRIGSGKWLVAMCICSWQFMSPDVGECSNCRLGVVLLGVHPALVPGFLLLPLHTE